MKINEGQLKKIDDIIHELNVNADECREITTKIINVLLIGKQVCGRCKCILESTDKIGRCPFCGSLILK